ncbi:MAG TPA: DUF4367 domain-containing protein [Candidatus Saccharimonadales bacterium]|nr:DUF4367 domain-containing protein [Candidatus Saccharimonadales bacterium]
MGTYNSTVFINGKRYDAATGQIISAIRSKSHKTNRVIDGFISRPLKSDAKPEPKRGRVKSSQVHKGAERPRTLMRGGLKKPTPSPKSDIQYQTSRPKIATQLRAQTIKMHAKVNRFGGTASPASDAPAKAVSGELVSRSRSGGDDAAKAPLPSMITSVSHQKLERLLDEALTRADAHKEALRYQAARHFWHRRFLSGRRKWIAVVAVFFVAAGGLFAAWRNVPQLSVKVAGMKAHVSAAVPSYKPDGFVVASPAKAVGTGVTMKYKSAADDSQTYEISQTRSHLTSQLVSQSVVPKGAPVQTSQVNGNTVYIYGPANDAAWVNDGVLYTIKDGANLSSDQLIKIVQGLNP